MCKVCGCGSDEVHIEGGHHHHHEHGHDHQGQGHEQAHAHGHDLAHTHPAAAQPIVINHYYQAGAQVFQYSSPSPDSDSGRAAAPAHHHHHDNGHTHDQGHEEVLTDAEGHSGNGGWTEGQDLDFGANPAGVTVTGIPQQRLVQLEKNILEKNDSLAKANRAGFDSKRVFAVNLISSPGAGKTTLIAKTVEDLRRRRRTAAAIIGDQQTSRDADRIRETGADALQINTGRGCHLDAHMVGHAAENLGLHEDSILVIENVGNLVCPAGFDLGEHRRVVMLSVTEGDDKPLKYPAAIAGSQLLLINKMDLLAHVDFDVDACERYTREKNPGIRIIRLSASTGDGFEEWISWLESAGESVAGNRASGEAAVRA